MPPSQLKRLKASLREQGIVGPQQSKKQKKQNAQNGVQKEKRVHRTEALNTIRDQFNPFEYKWSKTPKFGVTTNKNLGNSKGAIVGRPYVQKSRAEEEIKQGLLYDRQNRNKVGGIQDRRFGENDPTMDPETKMLQRSADLAQRRSKQSAFDLDDDEPGELTHMGQSLSLDGPSIQDDFEEELSEAESDEEQQSRKRRRVSEDANSEDEGEDEETEGQPERKKSKQEVMKEVMAKSKLYKYERQAAKDDDEDLREELDKDFQDIHALLRGMGSKPPPPATIAASAAGMNPDRAALLKGPDKIKFEKEYDIALKKMAQEKRSIPSERTKTEEEIAAETAKRMKDLEERRIRGMKGPEQSSDEEDALGVEEEEDDDDAYGLGTGLKAQARTELDIEDEDDFLIDDDLVASGSDIEASDGESSDQDSDVDADEGEDTQFFKSLEEDAQRPNFLTGANAPLPEIQMPEQNGVNGNLAYTFKCPESNHQLVEITKGVAATDLPTVVQRIRLQYDPKLASENKAKLGRFGAVLVEHIAYLANLPKPPPLSVLETLIRHVHSMARTSYPVEIAKAFRQNLKEIHESRALFLLPGDLVLLTAIGTIFPTSDHFHQVVTPAILTMGRYLGLKIPQTLSDYALGAYLCTLCLQYQKVSRRYIPEVMNFIENTICVLAPAKMSTRPGNFPYHEPKQPVRIDGGSPRRLSFYDCLAQDLSDEEEASSKLALLETNLKLAEAAADTWNGTSAFFEIFEPVLRIVQHLAGKNCRSKLPKTIQASVNKLSEKLNIQLKLAHLSRRPLELHHHRPLPIKMAIPKFEESFNPDKHYDPDRERSEVSKLRKEFKRERKGAIRDIRKDTKALARESLREKKEKDAAYDKKYKRLIAEIQGEEGHESKEYEREKEWRKKGKK